MVCLKKCFSRICSTYGLERTEGSCYRFFFCLTNVQGYSHKTRKNIQYPDLPSAIRPVQHSVDLPIPIPPASLPTLDKESSTCSKSSGAHFEPSQIKDIPHLITLEDLYDLVRDLNLLKGKSEPLGSRLQQCHMLSLGTKFSFYRQRSKRSPNLFSTDNELCYCNDIPILFESIGMNYDPDDWRLFIDGFKASIKAVLLHHGKILPSVPIAYSTTLKEIYNTLQFILNGIC